eukprot:gene14624-31116_t
MSYLDADHKIYCEECARDKVDELIRELPPYQSTDTITFRPVDGGYEGSLETNFDKIHSEPWPIHVPHHDAIDEG